MDRSQKLIVCCIGLTLCLSIPLIGCSGAFASRARALLDSKEIADGSVVELVREHESNSLNGSSSDTLRIRRVADEVVQSYAIDLEDPSGGDYSLHVDAEKRRAWVVDARSKRVVLSVDFADEKAWRYPVDHPEWARGG